MKKTVIFLALGALLLQGCKKEPDHGESPYDWPLSSPAAQGLDKSKIDAAYRKALELGSVDALLVIRNGYLVAEEYYNGNDRNDPPPALVGHQELPLSPCGHCPGQRPH